MTAQVVGFEGHVDDAYDVTWGTAAVRVDDRLLNPTLGLTSPINVLSNLAEEGALHVCSKGIDIDPDELRNPLLVLLVNKKSPYAPILSVSKNRHGGIVERKVRDGATCFVLRDRDALSLYARDVIRKIVASVFASEENFDGRLVQAGLSLDSAHPYLHALRAHFAAENQEHVAELARSCVRGARGLAAFNEMRNALRSKGKYHTLRYEQGIAEGGGLDVKRASQILSAVGIALRKLAASIRTDFPFLPPVPDARLFALEPGSARLKFSADVGGKLGERVARYFELRALQRALRGDIPEDLQDDWHFEEALEAIAHPTADTSVSQQSFDETEPEPVYLAELPTGDTTDHQLTLLGFVTGVLAEAGRLEVRIFHGGRGRLLLSTNDDGNGGKPEGLEFLEQASVSWYRLARLELTRRSDTLGRERFFLRKHVAIGSGPVVINAVPSTVVRGAFRLTNPLTVDVRDMSTSPQAFGQEQLNFQGHRARAHEWLRRYRSFCEEIELTDSRGEWLRAVRRTSASSLARTLISLQHLGGEALANAVAEEISRRYETITRVNNTRRVVLHNKPFVRWADEDEKRVILTERGALFVKAFERAGGDRGLEEGQSRTPDDT